jgi:hypothetical protein
MQNKTLIIAGMHRSGTSLITQWLYRCGLHVGENLLGSGIGNEDGHYEDLEFYNFQVQALINMNLPDSGLIDSPAGPLLASDKEKLKEIIVRRNKAVKEWGWKDPRTCLFLDEYRNLLPEAYYLVVFRDWKTTVSSLISRTYKVDYKDHEIIKKGLFKEFRKKRTYNKRIKQLCIAHATHLVKVWTFYNNEILNCISEIDKDKYTVINFGRLLESDKSLFSKLKEDWQFGLDYYAFKDIYKPGLLSKPIDFSHFVDENLIEEANRLEKILEQKAGVKLQNQLSEPS